MRIIDDNTVAFESTFERKYAEYTMDLVSKNPLWETNQANFLFRGSFIEYSPYLAAFCLLSIEQNKKIIITEGIPTYGGIDIDSLTINGFSVELSVNGETKIKQKKLNKLAKHWLKSYTFNSVQVLI